MKADNFFTSEEKDTIAKTIGKVEKKTAGEVAVMVVDTSDSYPESLVLAGVLMGGLSALLVTDLFFNDSLWIFLPLATLFSFVFGWLTNQAPIIKRYFIPKARIEEEVEQRAIQAFYEKGLYKTRDDTGVLFFISLLEHKAWVLADQGIYSKIPQETLQEYAVDIATGIKKGRAAEVLCQEISKVGEILAEHFPVKDDDTNELPNKVFTV
ncbi:MAG: hypothetical protein H8E41_02100 [Desulfobulbaceae bacterium]|uniref:TPM domain-containing protein n=1 Tax=Candidatus Desulfobia pelagia TaxID=2841692 RepID=A0A8J6NDY4_9BACT|nr:hypothetical protein [Candidatus Desulfobia pelagia]